MKPIRTAMIVDDSAVEHYLYERVLKQSGLVETVIGFYMPDEALAYLRTADRSDIDVILLDMRMPRMDGIEFLEAAIEEFGDDFVGAVIIMLTLPLEPSDRERAAAIPTVKGYFNKPLEIADMAKLAAMIDRA